jgi:hypothetical protein
MRYSIYPVSGLVTMLQERKVATLGELKAALGGPVDMTVFRKLREVNYCTSYSHRGMFYALKAVARFDNRGLWTCQQAHFSRFGSLVDTAEHFVLESERGLRASELSGQLQVETKEALLTLLARCRVVRERIGGCFVYFSPDFQRRRQQVLERQLPPAYEPGVSLWNPAAKNVAEARAAIILFLSVLDERQRRLYAGTESLRWGRGGDRRMAELTGMDEHTVAKGRRELQRGKLEETMRRRGGGRTRLEKKDQL